MTDAVRGFGFAGRCLLIALAAAWPRPSSAQVQFETVHEFVQGPGRVHGRLVQAVDGNLYGVTQEGGAYSGGTVFVMRRSGGEWMPAVTVHDFRSSEGTEPAGGLIEGSPGVLYGTTSKQGAFGGGTVFRISVFGTFQVLASLNPAIHGAQSIAELTRGPDLNFYGTALAGGAFGYGTVFRITPGGVLTVLHAFAGVDGVYPAGALALGLDGNLYGTTYYGGANSRGTVFRISRTGAFTQLHAFGPYGPILPAGRLTLASDGAFYGAASRDEFCVPIFCGELPVARGSLFKVTHSGVVSDVAVFYAGGGGGVTQGRDGWLYGTTSALGVYRVRPGTGQFEWVADGSLDYGAGAPAYNAFVQADDGRFYMGTVGGGVGGYGTIFSVSPAGDVRVHHSFRSDGFHPASTLLHGEGGILYGSTYSGGSATVGTYFAAYISGVVDTLASHPAGHGNPIGDLVRANLGFLAPTDARIMSVVDRNVTMAWQSAPVGTPELDPNGVIYAASNGYSLDGAIVRTNPDEVVHAFNGADGSRPSGLMYWDGTFYGVTREGGASGMGTVFSVKPDGTFATLHHFNGADGKWPVTQLSLSIDADGAIDGLIGTTTAGGNTSTSADGAGTVFRVSLDGATFTTLHAFAPGEGSQPLGRLWWTYADRRYFGTTFTGGLGYGTVYAVSPDGTFETIHQFAPGEGAFPYAGLSQGPDGALYGTTVFGGRANVGTIYRIEIPEIMGAGAAGGRQ